VLPFGGRPSSPFDEAAALSVTKADGTSGVSQGAPLLRPVLQLAKEVRCRRREHACRAAKGTNDDAIVGAAGCENASAAAHARHGDPGDHHDERSGADRQVPRAPSGTARGTARPAARRSCRTRCCHQRLDAEGVWYPSGPGTPLSMHEWIEPVVAVELGAWLTFPPRAGRHGVVEHRRRGRGGDGDLVGARRPDASRPPPRVDRGGRSRS
jgi:hypothetical protein